MPSDPFPPSGISKEAEDNPVKQVSNLQISNFTMLLMSLNSMERKSSEILFCLSVHMNQESMEMKGKKQYQTLFNEKMLEPVYLSTSIFRIRIEMPFL